MDNCIFCKIARGEIPSRIVYEDDEVLAFHDVQPQVPVHLLVIPRQHISSLAEADMSHQRVLGKMLAMSGRLAREQGAADGFRAIINTGRVGGQEVYHLHMHILGGPQPLGRMLPKS